MRAAAVCGPSPRGAHRSLQAARQYQGPDRSREAPCPGQGGVIVADLVDHFGIWLQRHKPVGEADRDQDLVPRLGGKNNIYMPAISRRAPAQVDNDVEYRPARHTHQLVLGEGRCLKMQAAHRSLISRVRVVILHEVDVDPSCNKCLFVVRLGKEATLITVLPGDSAP